MSLGLSFNRSRRARLGAVVAACVCLLTSDAVARVRLENICSVQGQKEQKLIGLGLIIGLPGTGDGGDFQPTIRALGAALNLLKNPVEGKSILKDANNLALVMVEATVPATGIRRGQKIDCYVNSIGAAKSLLGGRLLAAPLQRQLVAAENVVGVASGAVIIENPAVKTSGKISEGVVIEEDFDEFVALFIENNGFTLLLDPAHSSFHAASEVAHAVNADISFESNSQTLARAIGPGVIRVTVPVQYRNDPVEFVAQVLDVGIDNPHTQARVVLNVKSKTIVVTGEVEISPVVVAHGNLSVSVAGEEPDAGGGGDENRARFVPLMEKSRQAPQHLSELIEALNQLKVPTADIIDIIKDLNRSGKLHAVVISE